MGMRNTKPTIAETVAKINSMHAANLASRAAEAIRENPELVAAISRNRAMASKLKKEKNQDWKIFARRADRMLKELEALAPSENRGRYIGKSFTATQNSTK